MAITVNGAVLRNMPEQISKNVDDIANLQTTSENHENRIVALENDVVLAASFQDTTMTGTTSISGTMNVSASSAFSNGITANSITSTAATVGSLTVSGNETVSGTLGVGGTLTASGDVSVGGNLGVTGSAQIFENITDASGNKRFIEGAATTYTISGVDFVYTRWALSGTHLMIVVAGKIESGTTIPAYQNIASVTLPSWVSNKITPIFSTVVAVKKVGLLGADYTTSELSTRLMQVGNDLLIQNFNDAHTSTQIEYFRYQFDLIIDNQ